MNSPHTGRGQGKAVVCFHTTEQKRAYLIARSRSVGLKYTQFARAIYNQWLLSGAPPIDDLEKKRGVLEMPKELITELKETNLYHP